MEILVEVHGEKSTDRASDLRSWLASDRTVRVDRASQNTKPGAASEMGPELLPILTVMLASPLLVELVKSVFGWLSAARAKNTVTLTVNGKSVTVSSEDGATVVEVIKALSK